MRIQVLDAIAANYLILGWVVSFPTQESKENWLAYGVGTKEKKKSL